MTRSARDLGYCTSRASGTDRRGRLRRAMRARVANSAGQQMGDNDRESVTARSHGMRRVPPLTLSPLAGRGQGEGGSPASLSLWKGPLTPTLSPQAGRGSSAGLR